MNYEKLVQGILNIGEAMLQCGAEIFRVEDSLYRMYKSYGFMTYDVYVIPSNIQVTVETPEGEIITQIRHIESSEPNFHQLDYLNNLCRYVCQHTPDEKEMREKYLEVINREPQKRITRYAAGIMGGTGFAVFFGCNVWDAIVALIVSVMIVAVGDWLVPGPRGMGGKPGKPLNWLKSYSFVYIRSDHYSGIEDGSCRSSGPYYDRYRYAADQWTGHDEWNP